MFPLRIKTAVWLLLALPTAYAADDPVLDAMQAELSRSQTAYFSAKVPAYFIAYRIDDIEQIDVNAEFGVLHDRAQGHRRILNVELRTGDYKLDNWQNVGLEVDPLALRAQIWSATDAAYWESVEQLGKVKANTAVKTAAEDKSDDFSHESKVDLQQPPQDYSTDLWQWADKVKSYSAPFKLDPKIYKAKAGLTLQRTTRWLVNSEGTRTRDTRLMYLLDIRAVTKADDGMELPRMVRFVATRLEDLPSDAAVQGAVKQLMADLAALRAAPLATAYEGPAILEGKASGVFFHEMIGHRLEAHRMRQEEDAQTFKKKLNEKILPANLSITFDPSVSSFNGQALMGSYAVDDDGVKSRPVPVVVDGVLKNFLVSRTPVEGFPTSNGHGRAAPGMRPVARQSNMIVSVKSAPSAAELKQKLLADIKAQNKPWGLIIRDLDGGYTNVARSDISSAKLLPTMVYRVYPDGREELVRGVDMVGTPLTLIAEVTDADDHYGVLHGWCGAESGYVPVSTVAPDLLIRRIEVQRKPKNQDRPPLLPTPAEEGR